jgi:hypothetical protein
MSCHPVAILVLSRRTISNSLLLRLAGWAGEERTFMLIRSSSYSHQHNLNQTIRSQSLPDSTIRVKSRKYAEYTRKYVKTFAIYIYIYNMQE